jgi:molybdopterin converting factor small subunit
MRILFYGRLAEAIAPEIELDNSAGRSVSQLREMLAAAHPDAAAILASKRSRACVGQVLVGEDHLIGAGDQVEFLPPVSGG